MVKLKVGVLISGRGSNLKALIEAAAAPDYPATIALAISNVPTADGLALARARGIPAVAIDHRTFGDRPAFDRAVDSALREAGVELVCLAGFMRLLGPTFVESWHDRLINIHPSLLPAFKGLHSHERAIAAGNRVAGCTIHFVRNAMDSGPIIAQAAVPIHPGDTAETLAGRVLQAEHRLYPQVVRWFGEGRIAVRDERVEVAGAGVPAATLFNPPID